MVRFMEKQSILMKMVIMLSMRLKINHIVGNISGSETTDVEKKDNPIA